MINSRRFLAILVVAYLASATAAQAQTVLVLPYVQPGDGRMLTGTDVKVVHWLTDQTPGDFFVDFRLPCGLVRTVRPTRLTLDFPAPRPPADEPAPKKIEKKVPPPGDPAEGKEPSAKKKRRYVLPPEKDQHYFKYTAQIDNLPFNAVIRYRVRLDCQIVRQAHFHTRATPDRWTRCVLVGDMAQNSRAQHAVAYHIGRWRPRFLVALGDIVYPTGRVNQYMHHFWNTYNDVDVPDPWTGAPLMATIPFYPVLGNHDIGAKLSKTADALAAYHFFSPPKGGPGEGPWITPLGSDANAVKFRELTPNSYPNLDAYSFDYGAAHFVVLNDNKGLKITAPAFRRWLREDLKNTTANWKFVCFHVPGFHSSTSHYSEQQARLLQPIFEETGVDIAFAGHVHNYQRSVPLKFVPQATQAKRGRVNGEFTLDKNFDGVTKTRPSGVIHIVAGGGGAGLYGPGLDQTAEYLRETYGANYADFTARMVADRHSFVVLDIGPDQLEFRAIGANGAELDRMRVTR